MLTFKIEWQSDFHPNYSVYTGHNYSVCKYKPNQVTSEKEPYVQLLIDGALQEAAHNIELGAGCKVYIMNDRGATIDKIYV